MFLDDLTSNNRISNEPTSGYLTSDNDLDEPNLILRHAEDTIKLQCDLMKLLLHAGSTNFHLIIWDCWYRFNNPVSCNQSY